MARPPGIKAELEARRRRAVDLLELGHGVREMAEVVGAHPDSISRWNAAYEEEGEKGLAAAPRTNGRTPKLAEEHCPALEERLREGSKAGFETNLWTLDRIAEIIEREFDILVSSSSVWRSLQKMGWSCQKPEQRARERDDEEIRRWMTETWPAIKKSANGGIHSRVRRRVRILLRSGRAPYLGPTR